MKLDNKIEVISFDADDTLWINEPYFQEAGNNFNKLLNKYLPEQEITRRLLETEHKNIPAYGFGAKAFTLSLLETAIKVSDYKVNINEVEKILNIAKELINSPLILLDNVEMVLQKLSKHYRLIVATKGDLLDQRRKLKNSGLAKYFHHIEVMTDKKEENYLHLLKRIDVVPDRFLMIGNSLKSDILPVVNIGAQAIHIPFHVTWELERVNEEHINQINYTQAEKLTDILQFLL